jgi:hypothetical protein
MTRFLHWRKMTWALLLWTAAMGVFAVRAARATAPECGAYGLKSKYFTREECLAATSAGIGVVPVTLIWVLGLAVLGALWFITRPLWRQGHGVRVRRLRSGVMGWQPRDLSRLTKNQ